jgi:antitoxin CcdA
VNMMQRSRGTAGGSKKPTNVSLDAGLVEEAKSLGINLSQACERGLSQQIAELRAQAWRDENREALASSNAFVETHGLPLARLRQF